MEQFSVVQADGLRHPHYVVVSQSVLEEHLCQLLEVFPKISIRLGGEDGVPEEVVMGEGVLDKSEFVEDLDEGLHREPVLNRALCIVG